MHWIEAEFEHKPSVAKGLCWDRGGANCWLRHRLLHRMNMFTGSWMQQPLQLCASWSSIRWAAWRHLRTWSSSTCAQQPLPCALSPEKHRQI